MDRSELEATLRDWAAGRLSVLEVVDSTEEAQRVGADGGQTDLALHDVIEKLAWAHHELITVDDVPHLLALLAESTPVAPERLAAWHAYWDQVDWEQRRAALASDPSYVT